MLPYILTFVAVAFFPLVLAGYGGHLATLALPEGRKRITGIFIVWVLAIVGVVVFGISQIVSYGSDKDRVTKDNEFRQKVLSQLQQIANEPSPAKRQIEAQVLGTAIANAPRPKRSILTKKAAKPEPLLITDTETLEFAPLSISGDGSVGGLNPIVNVVITAAQHYEHPSIQLSCSDPCIFDSASLDRNSVASALITATPASELGLLPNSSGLIVTVPSAMEPGDRLTIKLRSDSSGRAFFVYGVHPVGK